MKKIDLESLCRNCGKCCAIKKVIDGKLVFTDKYCPHLQKREVTPTTFCDIYDQRIGTSFEIEGDETLYRCISVQESYKKGGLPNDCPYVLYFSSHPEALGVMEKQEAKERVWLAFAKGQYACEKQDWSKVIPGPKPNCRHCYGRGYEGRDIKSDTYVLCRCVNG